MSTNPEVSIVIVTFNAQDIVLDCLASIPAGGAEAEVIVVDNRSEDRTVDLIREHYPEVRIIQTGYNAGYSGGNNIGIRAAAAPLILLLNPDATLHPGALRALIDFARAHPNAGMVGGRMLYPDGRLQHNGFRFPNLTMAFFGFFGLVPLDSPLNGRYPLAAYEHDHEVEHLLGAALLVRREVVEQVGLMDDKTFPMYFEESDWCYRTHRAGWKLYYTPTATITHYGSYTTSRYPEEMSIAFHRSQARFYRRHYGLLTYLALKAIAVAGLCFWFARSTLSLVRRRISAETWWRRARGYWKILWT